jgi:hypothetical protein
MQYISVVIHYLCVPMVIGSVLARCAGGESAMMLMLGGCRRQAVGRERRLRGKNAGKSRRMGRERGIGVETRSEGDAEL